MKLGLLPVLALVFVAGCNSSSSDAAATTPSSINGAAPSTSATTPPTTVAPSEVIAPRGDSSTVDPTDYLASQVPYRLFGTGKGDGATGASAVIADAKTWSTRTYRVGDTVGRGLKVKAIAEHSVTLHSATADIVLNAGASSTPLRFIAHKLDLAVTSLGKMTYRLDMKTVAQVPVVLPTAEKTEVFGETVLRLGPVQPDTLLAQADFKEGDLLAGIDGAGIGDDGLVQLKNGLTVGTDTLLVKLVRDGASYDRTYLKQ